MVKLGGEEVEEVEVAGVGAPLVEEESLIAIVEVVWVGLGDDKVSFLDAQSRCLSLVKQKGGMKILCKISPL